jgi:hypothetical protein
MIQNYNQSSYVARAWMGHCGLGDLNVRNKTRHHKHASPANT